MSQLPLAAPCSSAASLHAKGAMENAPLLGVARRRKSLCLAEPHILWVCKRVSISPVFFFKESDYHRSPSWAKPSLLKQYCPVCLPSLSPKSQCPTFIAPCTEQNFTLFPLKQDTFWWIVFFPIALFLLNNTLSHSEYPRYINRSIHVSRAASANRKSFQLLGTDLFWHVIQPWSNQWGPQLSAAICKDYTEPMLFKIEVPLRLSLTS